jgi:hypothetical protein
VKLNTISLVKSNTMSSSNETITAICLNLGGTISEIPIPRTFSVDNFDLRKIPMKYTKHIGSGAISRECDYSYMGNKVSVFAYTEGSVLNKHELPPPIDEERYYGNIYIIYHDDDGQVLDLTEDDYNNFYASSFGGFEEIGDEDSERSEDDEDDDGEDLKDFIVDDDDEEDDEDDDDYEDDEDDQDDDEDDEEPTEHEFEQWKEELESYEVMIDTLRERRRDIPSSVLRKYADLKDKIKRWS